jgi:hypothetical protein
VRTSGVEGRAPESTGKWVFYPHENRYFRAQVWNSGNNRGKHAYRSGAEEELET